MKYVVPTTVCWLAACAAAVGCAGKLDNEAAFFEDHVLKPDASMPAAGSRAPAAAGSSGTSSNDGSTSNNSGNVSQGNSGNSPRPSYDAGTQEDAGEEYDDAGPGGSVQPAAGSGGAGKPTSANCDFPGLLQMKCGNASCHGGPNAGTGLDLTSASLAMRVADRKGSGACANKLIVDKNNPEQSELYLKVSGADCGVRMPLGGTLSADDQACVLSWMQGL
jgi:hypothetical protein